MKIKQKSFIIKSLIISCLFITTSQKVVSQNSDSTRLLLIEMIDILSKNAIYKDKISIDFLTQKADSLLIAKKDSLRKVPYLFVDYLKYYGDSHVAYFSPRRESQKSKELPIDKMPKLMILDSQFGYIKIPSFSTRNELDYFFYSESVNAFVHKIKAKYNPKGWIIDFRNNGGGYSNSMLSSLYPFLVHFDLYASHSEKDISTKTKKGKVLDKYHKKNIVHPDLLPSLLSFSESPKIVVLINKKTASAGEVTSMVLSNLPNTILMGDSTMGLMTAMKHFNLYNGGKINVPIGFLCDAKGNCPDRVYPSFYYNDDEILDKAKKWILEKDNPNITH